MKNNQQAGFTLIELLVAAVLIVMVSTVTVSIVTTSLRSASKTTLAGNIRQSGNYATEQIMDFVRFATQFKISTQQIVDSNSSTYTTYCSNSSTQYHYLELTTTNNNTATFYCDSTTNAGSNPPIASNGAKLIDTTAVNVVSCYFTCSQASSSSPPTIGISFTLSQVGSANFAENNVSLPFSDSAFMRNISN